MKEIRINNLSKSYAENLVLDSINCVLNSSKVYFLTSGNGSGKTTFFNCLLREISFDGKIIDQDLIYSYLPDKVKLPIYVKVIDFITMFLDDNNIEINNKINYYFELFKISKYRNYYVNQLSKGSKQKVLIILTLLSVADVYLFDEPLTGLDYNSRLIFMEEVKSLQSNNKIVVIASHYYDEYKLSNKEVINL